MCCGRISVEQTRSATEGLIAKLEEQAADEVNGDGEAEPEENGGEEDEEEDDSDDVRFPLLHSFRLS